jgi:hypothetical protein
MPQLKLLSRDSSVSQYVKRRCIVPAMFSRLNLCVGLQLPALSRIRREQKFFLHHLTPGHCLVCRSLGWYSSNQPGVKMKFSGLQGSSSVIPTSAQPGGLKSGSAAGAGLLNQSTRASLKQTPEPSHQPQKCSRTSTSGPFPSADLSAVLLLWSMILIHRLEWADRLLSFSVLPSGRSLPQP